jgi:uncharacterized membrane protein SpoIIM required for sporulation
MKNKLVVLSGLGLALTPFLAFAQNQQLQGCAGNVGGTLFGFLCIIENILNFVMPVIIALGAVYFIWGVVSYVVASEEEAKTKGRDRMIYGLIGLVVIISMWGLVGILKSTFGLNNQGANVQVPCITGTPGC